MARGRRGGYRRFIPRGGPALMTAPALKVVAGRDALPTTPLAGALFMIARGFSVFPLKPNSKDPFTWRDRDVPKALRGGIHRATREPELVKHWFKQYPTLNYGVPVDFGVAIDGDKKAGPHWMAEVRALCELL